MNTGRGAFLILCGLTALGLSAFVGELQSQNTGVDLVTPRDLEKDIAKAPPPIAELFRNILETRNKSAPTEGIPFEQRALDLVTSFLNRKFSKDVVLSRNDRFRAAEKALQALTWSLETDGARSASRKDLRFRLRQKLLDVRQEQLTVAVEEAKNSGAWDAALAVGLRLLEIYPRNVAVSKQVRRVLVDVALDQTQKDDFIKARKTWQRCQELFLDSPEMQPVQDSLQKRSQELMAQAEPLTEVAAREKLALALSLWPRTPGLRDSLAKRQGKYTVLHVGVRELPEFLSPATAWLDSENVAVDLLFESLIEPVIGASGTQHYSPRLAVRLPEINPLSRRFTLRRDIYWSDGERVIPADVRHTVLLTTEPNRSGRDVTWREFMDIPLVEGMTFMLEFPLRQGLFDPEAQLCFRVLPQAYHGKPLARADDPEFAKFPVGSGPFVYAGRREMKGRPYAAFAANPQFERTDRPSQPQLREIRFFAWKDQKDLEQSEARFTVLLDIPTELVPGLSKIGTHKIQTLHPRRVHFLALNHRLPVLANDRLRRALGHGIDREAILNRHFRGTMVEEENLLPAGAALALPFRKLSRPLSEFHRILNGPYPVQSWACSPDVPRDLLDVNLAKSQFREIAKDAATIKLTLKFPDNDPHVRKACLDIVRQVGKLASDAGVNMQLLPVALPPQMLKQAVDRRDYELAYFHWDYDDESYWLWPMFDPQPAAVQAGGSNFLGYDNDSELQQLFRAASSHRQFTAVHQTTHQVHAHLIQKKMVLIPLWQLDSHIAVPSGLKTGPLRAGHIFSNASHWQLTTP